MLPAGEEGGHPQWSRRLVRSIRASSTVNTGGVLDVERHEHHNRAVAWEVRQCAEIWARSDVKLDLFHRPFNSGYNCGPSARHRVG